LCCCLTLHALHGGAMSELRKDVISGRWVIISVERGKRPTILSHHLREKRGADSVHSVPGMSIRRRQKLWHSDLLIQKAKFSRLDLTGNVEQVPCTCRFLGDLNKSGEGIFDKMSESGPMRSSWKPPTTCSHLQLFHLREWKMPLGLLYAAD